MRARLEAIPDRKLRGMNTDAGVLAGRVLDAIPGIEAHRRGLAGLDDEVVAALDRLEDGAWALLHLDASVDTVDAQSRLRALVAEGETIRRHLAPAARFLAGRGLLDADAVAAAPNGAGHANLARALMVLGNAFLAGAAAVENKTTVTVAEARRAVELGGEIPAAVHTVPRSKSERARLKPRAYTALLEDYEEVALGIAFLRRKCGDAQRITPPVLGRGRRPGRRAGDASSGPTLLAAAAVAPSIVGPASVAASSHAGGRVLSIADAPALAPPAHSPGRLRRGGGPGERVRPRTGTQLRSR